VGIVNRRNAVIGWAVWTLAGRMLKREQKSRAAVAKKSERPEQAPGTRKRWIRSTVAIFVAAAIGTATYLRARGTGGDAEAQ
jgi:hypothetical protein